MPPLPRLWRISYRSLTTVPGVIGGGGFAFVTSARESLVPLRERWLLEARRPRSRRGEDTDARNDRVPAKRRPSASGAQRVSQRPPSDSRAGARRAGHAGRGAPARKPTGSRARLRRTVPLPRARLRTQGPRPVSKSRRRRRLTRGHGFDVAGEGSALPQARRAGAPWGEGRGRAAKGVFFGRGTWHDWTAGPAAERPAPGGSGGRSMTNLDPVADKVVRDAVDAFLDGYLAPQLASERRGETAFETKNSRYRLVDGVVVAAPDDSLIGAELVGWLIESARRSVVESAWQPGSRAVLVDRHRGRNIIVTSTTRLLHPERARAREPRRPRGAASSSCRPSPAPTFDGPPLPAAPRAAAHERDPPPATADRVGGRGARAPAPAGAAAGTSSPGPSVPGRARRRTARRRLRRAASRPRPAGTAAPPTATRGRSRPASCVIEEPPPSVPDPGGRGRLTHSPGEAGRTRSGTGAARRPASTPAALTRPAAGSPALRARTRMTRCAVLPRARGNRGPPYTGAASKGAPRAGVRRWRPRAVRCATLHAPGVPGGHRD